MNEIPCPLLFCRGVLKHVSSGFPRRTPEDSSVIGTRSLQHPHSCIVLRGVAVAIPFRACAATCYASAAGFFGTRTRHGNLFDIRDHPHAGVHSSAAHMQDETRLFLGFARVVCGVHGWPARLPACPPARLPACLPSSTTIFSSVNALPGWRLNSFGEKTPRGILRGWRVTFPQNKKKKQKKKLWAKIISPGVIVFFYLFGVPTGPNPRAEVVCTFLFLC